MKPLSTGFAGLNFGRTLARSGVAGGSILPAACFDPRPETCREFAREYGCRPCASLQELLEQPGLEAVVIASPNPLHPEQAGAAAARGLHVFVEKPIANTPAEAREIIRRCREAGVVLAVGHSLRHHGAFATIRRLIGEGRIGRPTSVECHMGASNAFALKPGDWRSSAAACPGLALIQLGIHTIDAMRTILGEVTGVAARFAHLMVKLDNPDLNALVLEFDSGALGTLVTSYIDNDYFTAWHGSEGVLRYHGWPDQATRIERLDRLGRVEQGDHWIEFAPVDANAVELLDFQRAVREGTRPAADGEEGLRNLLVVTAAIESANSGRWVRIEELG